MDFSGFCKESIRHIKHRVCGSYFLQARFFIYLFSAKLPSRLHLVVRNFLRSEANYAR
nr:MAG TPA: hypothetical protein [Caudoviricetes sp.]